MSATDEAKAQSETGGAPALPSSAATIQFMKLLYKLKTTKRAGWLRHNIQGAESIADHMYRMAMLSVLMTGSGYRVDRLVQMALVHDVAEAIVGDITPYDDVSKEEKREREAAAIEEICAMLGKSTPAARLVHELWWEYETSSSPEALLCKDFDKLEMLVQAWEYEGEQGKDLEEFFTGVQGRWRTQRGEDLAREIIESRRADAAAAAADGAPPAS